jgi:hypothetical protein
MGPHGRDIKEAAAMGRAIPEPPRDFDKTLIIQRPDGFYWQSEATGEEYGPFPTRAEALADIEFGAPAEELEADETLEEAEADIGVSGWVDPDTGDLGESWTPRLEDH